MFDIDRWQEIFSSIRSNVLRTVLSGFTVALGLFIFIVLFGIGSGLEKSFSDAFRGDATNLISIMTGKTSIAFNGLQENRTISLNNEDFQEISKAQEKKIEYKAPRYDAQLNVKYGKESGNYQVVGSTGDEFYTENRKMMEGRYVNTFDIERKSHVAVIGRMVQRDLIKDGSPVGKKIWLNGIGYTVIGVFSDVGGDRDERMITIPISSLQQMKKGSDSLSHIYITYDKEMIPQDAVKMGDEIEKQLKSRKQVSPEDEQGIIVYNNAKNLETTFQFLFVLGLIVGVIGLGTLLAGIIGISNIMVYIVKERTKEIGVRKAIGASPKSIVGLIIQESMVITIISGIIGVAIGVLTLKLIGNGLEKYFIKEPSVGWGIIFLAFLSLVFAGFIAGFVPAYRASRIKPIEALRTE